MIVGLTRAGPLSTSTTGRASKNRTGAPLSTGTGFANACTTTPDGRVGTTRAMVTDCRQPVVMGKLRVIVLHRSAPMSLERPSLVITPTSYSQGTTEGPGAWE